MDSLLYRWLGRNTFIFLLLIATGEIHRASDVIADAQLSQQPLVKNVLEKKITISMADTSVYDIIQLLRMKYNVPISFIDAEEKQKITVDLKDASLRTVLEKVISSSPIYDYRIINERLVLYPKVPKYNFIVNDVDINMMKRLEAANKYVSQLNHQFPEFMDLVGPPVLGNPQHPVFIDKVSLKRESTVLEHLVQLLGEDLKVVFSIIKAKSGVPILVFERVKE